MADIANEFYIRKLELGTNVMDIVEALEAICEVFTVSLPLMDERQQTTSRLLVDTLTDVKTKAESTFTGPLLAAKVAKEVQELPHPSD